MVDEYFQTNVPGIFAAGNVLHVHDLVDFVSMEAENLADSAAEYIRDKSLPDCPVEIKTDRNINHTVPQRISGTRGFKLSMRVNRAPGRRGDCCKEDEKSHTGRDDPDGNQAGET